MKRIGWGGMAVVAALAGGWWLWSSTPEDVAHEKHASVRSISNAKTHSVSAADNAAMRRRLEQLELGQRRVLDELSALTTRLKHLDSAASDKTPQTENVEVSSEQPQDSADDVMIRYETAFGLESQDPEWSSDTEQRIVSLLDAERAPGTEVAEVSCQKSMCRLELAHTDDQAREIFLQALPMEPPFDEEGFFYPIGDEDAEATVVFIARAGHRLP